MPAGRAGLPAFRLLSSEDTPLPKAPQPSSQT
jgi:hypothetical protein